MMAGLFAAALSTINSGLNAMASTLLGDFYKRFKPDRSDRHYLRVGRLSVVLCGLILGSFALASVFWQESRPQTTLIDFALMVMVFAYSGLNAVFLTAVFTRRGSNLSVIAALIVGFLAVAIMQAKFAAVLAFPWQMLIGTLAALGVCLCGGSGAIHRTLSN
ncbi:MAG: sodium:solute symporter, partial [Calditrichota bacterium]